MEVGAGQRPARVVVVEEGGEGAAGGAASDVRSRSAAAARLLALARGLLFRLPAHLLLEPPRALADLMEQWSGRRTAVERSEVVYDLSAG